jgi:aerobic-type carbon monoxide dehydrogenase small subunit (CoxS/CutS family)
MWRRAVPHRRRAGDRGLSAQRRRSSLSAAPWRRRWHDPLPLNGSDVAVDAPPTERLSETLRERLGQDGHQGRLRCGRLRGLHGASGRAAVCACLTPAARVEGRAVTTVEGETPELTRLRASFLAHGAAQCGICTPGMLLTAAELLPDRPALRRPRWNRRWAASFAAAPAIAASSRPWWRRGRATCRQNPGRCRVQRPGGWTARPRWRATASGPTNGPRARWW